MIKSGRHQARHSDDGGIAVEALKYQWHYGEQEWDKHVEWQRRLALRGAIRSSFIAVIVCAGAALVSRSWIVVAVTLLLTGWIPVMEVLSANSSSKSLLGKPVDSIVGVAQVSYTHFVLGERVVRLDNRRILGAGIYGTGRGARGARGAADPETGNSDAAPVYLKIIHKGKMRRSSTLPELILIPEGKEEEAQEIVEALIERKLKEAQEEAEKRKPWQFWRRGE